MDTNIMPRPGLQRNISCLAAIQCLDLMKIYHENKSQTIKSSSLEIRIKIIKIKLQKHLQNLHLRHRHANSAAAVEAS